MFCFQRMGTWKITAHYEDDEANAASQEFKVQRFGKLIWCKHYTLFLINRNYIVPLKNTLIVTQLCQVSRWTLQWSRGIFYWMLNSLPSPSQQGKSCLISHWIFFTTELFCWNGINQLLPIYLRRNKHIEKHTAEIRALRVCRPPRRPNVPSHNITHI